MEDIIRTSKFKSEIWTRAFKKTKGEKCLVCNEKQTSFCDSHSIPQMVLKNIAKNGKVYHSTDALFRSDKYKRIFKTTKGLKEVLIFKNICNKCDNEIFQEIEDPVKLIKSDFSDWEYCSFVLKILLFNLYTKKFDFNLVSECYDISFDPSMLRSMYWWSADLKGISKELSEYLNARSNNANIKHKVIIDTILDFKVDFACNTMITPRYDHSGKQINDLSNKNLYNRKIGSIYLIVYPLETKTKIICFYRKKYRQYDSLKMEIDNLKIEDKLKVISDFLILYSDQYVYGEEIKAKITPNIIDNYDPTQSEDINLYHEALSELKNINLFS